MSFSQTEPFLAAAAFTLPRWEQLPDIGLYMDQLLGYVADVLRPLVDPDNGELTLTKSMVNNYVKQKVLPPPVKKRYGRSQVAGLLTLCLLKQVFSIPECRQLLAGELGGVDAAHYDQFCERFEQALHFCFDPAGPRSAPSSEIWLAGLLAGKLYYQKKIAYRQSLRRSLTQGRQTFHRKA